MPSKIPSVPDIPPHPIDPYDVLSLPPTASASEIKSAYKKLALLHHPDKVPPFQRDQAHTTFQNLAFAYAILSDERRRNRYDVTGNTAESLDIDDSDFDWTAFFRTQYADVVTGAKLDDFKAEYQNSEEERRDMLNAYRSNKGKMNAIYSRVMMSNPLEDEDRFRAIIDGAIEKDELEAYKAYTDESSKSKEARMKTARHEGAEAHSHAQKLGVHEKLFGPNNKNGKKAGAGEDDLAALIQQRGKGRAESFLDNLEKKYSKNAGKKKRGAADGPSEEAFERMAKRGKKRKEVEEEAVEVDNEGEEVVDLSEEEEEEEEEEEPPKRKKGRTRPTKKARGQVKKAKAQ